MLTTPGRHRPDPTGTAVVLDVLDERASVVDDVATALAALAAGVELVLVPDPSVAADLVAAGAATDAVAVLAAGPDAVALARSGVGVVHGDEATSTAAAVGEWCAALQAGVVGLRTSRVRAARRTVAVWSRLSSAGGDE